MRAADGLLDLFAVRVGAVDPARVLARGWSITRTSTGSVVRHVGDVTPGDVLITTLGDGTVTSTIDTITPHD